jgi:hypothetical protein
MFALKTCIWSSSWILIQEAFKTGAFIMTKFNRFHISAFMQACNCSFSQAVIVWETYFIQGIVTPGCFVGNWRRGWDERTVEDFMIP